MSPEQERARGCIEGARGRQRKVLALPQKTKSRATGMRNGVAAECATESQRRKGQGQVSKGQEGGTAKVLAPPQNGRSAERPQSGRRKVAAQPAAEG